MRFSGTSHVVAEQHLMSRVHDTGCPHGESRRQTCVCRDRQTGHSAPCVSPSLEFSPRGLRHTGSGASRQPLAAKLQDSRVLGAAKEDLLGIHQYFAMLTGPLLTGRRAPMAERERTRQGRLTTVKPGNATLGIAALPRSARLAPAPSGQAVADSAGISSSATHPSQRDSNHSRLPSFPCWFMGISSW